MDATGPHHELWKRAQGALVFWALGGLALAIVVMLHVAAEILLLTFGGLLFGTTLRGAAEWCSRRMRIGITASLVICIVVLAVLCAMAILWIAPHVGQQSGALWDKLMQAISDLQDQLQTTWIGHAVSTGPQQIAAWFARHPTFAEGVVMGVVGGIGAVVYVVFVALYFAFSPQTYRRGVLLLVPPAQQERAGQVLDELGGTLRRWLWARLVSMTVLGIASSVGLWLLGIPLALSLGLLAGVLLFVPYLGSIASAIPALLIAITVSPMHVVYVGLVYIGIHLADGYLLSPPLQRYAVRMPPLLVLVSQLVSGALWGLLGFMFATPLVASVMIITRMLYVEPLQQAPP